MKATPRGALTFWRTQRERLVRIQNESELLKGTHKLDNTEGGICQGGDRKQDYKGHSLPGVHRGRDLSEHRKQAHKGHPLAGECREAHQNMERKQACEGHTQTGEHRGGTHWDRV